MRDDLLEELKPYMLTIDVIKNITSVNDNKNMLKKIFEKNKINKEKNVVEKISTSYKLWTPYEKDQLFWCFYYVLYGEHIYEQSHKNNFLHETKMKIEGIEKLRNKKDLLKQNNIKLKNIEAEFTTNDNLTIQGIFALCILHNIRIIIIKEYTYLDIEIKDTVDGVIKYSNNNYSLKICEDKSCFFNKENIELIKKNRWRIMNPDKPIKSCGSYFFNRIARNK